MSVADLLSSLRGERIRRTPLRRRAASRRILRVESLESRLPLSVVPPALGLEPPDDSVTPGDCAAEEPLSAGIPIVGSVGGIPMTPVTNGEDAVRSLTHSAADGLSGGVSATIRDLQAGADGIVRGTVAADRVLACWQVELDVDNDGAADLYTFSGESDGFRYDLGTSLPAGQQTIQARVFQSREGFGDNHGDWRAIVFERQATPRVRQLVPTDRVLTNVFNGGTVTAFLDGLEAERIPAAEGEFPGSSPLGAPPGAPPGGPGGQISEELSAPVISSFLARAGLSDTWIFEGTVEYEEPWILTVNFGGLLAGHSTGVDNDGTFVFSLPLPPGTSGLVSAQAFTLDGEASNVAVDLVG